LFNPIAGEGLPEQGWLEHALACTSFLMSIEPKFVGLDVGGSSMKAGVVDGAGQVLSKVQLPTEARRGQAFGLERMCETIRLAITESGLSLDQIAAIGVATPGTMDIPAGIILDPPNLKPWLNVPVRRHIEEKFALPTAFQNDANAAAFGEYWVGAGRGAHSMVLFTLGTGVGGGIVIGDRVVEGEHSHGAELGHIIIEMTQPRLCGCGRRGCLEAYASASAVVRRTEEALATASGKDSILGKRNDADPLSCKEIFEAAATDDLARQIVDDTARYLAVAATCMLHTINPNVVVFAGGMIAAGDDFLEKIRRHVNEMAFPVPAERTLIRYAQLGSDAGFIGAAGCGRQKWLAIVGGN
jgi:glucokinase